jgi:hypothetical protein
MERVSAAGTFLALGKGDSARAPAAAGTGAEGGSRDGGRPGGE